MKAQANSARWTNSKPNFLMFAISRSHCDCRPRLGIIVDPDGHHLFRREPRCRLRGAKRGQGQHTDRDSIHVNLHCKWSRAGVGPRLGRDAGPCHVLLNQRIGAVVERFAGEGRCRRGRLIRRRRYRGRLPPYGRAMDSSAVPESRRRVGDAGKAVRLSGSPCDAPQSDQCIKTVGAGSDFFLLNPLTNGAGSLPR